MKWRVLSVCSLVLVLTQGTNVLTQRPSGKWWLSEPIQQELLLTADAVNQIDEIYEAELPILRSGYRAFIQLDKEFDEMLKRDDVSEAEVAHEVEHLEAARSELRKSRTLMLFRMQRVLTAEQRKLLDAYNERRREERREERRPRDSWGRP